MNTPIRVALLTGLLAVGSGLVASAAEPLADARRSGFDFMMPATQAMQRDDAQNPAMLSVADGEASWQRKSGRAEKSCADCHGAAATSMRGVAARYPAFDVQSARPVDLAQRINLCVEREQRAPPLRRESAELLGLEAFVALQSRGMPIAPPPDPRLDTPRKRGAQLYRQRMGQLDLACAQCHDANAGKRLAGSVIPQAHPSAYPIYRLEWQRMGSLQRRLRGCMTGIRAEPFAYGSAEFVELELYLKARAGGMPMESPGVRP
jgi:L-cysteine S-thiosulfotransferase